MTGLLLTMLLERCNTPVPEEVQEKSDATPGLDLSYLGGQALTETEETALKIATTDDDPFLEYADLYVHQKNNLVSQLDIRFESQQPKDVINIFKSTLLAELLFRKKVFVDQEGCHKFAKLAVKIFPDDSMTQLFELGETVSPLAKTGSLFVEPKESETILRVAKILKEADLFWLALPPEHQFKKIPIHEIVSTFFDQLNSGKIKIRYSDKSQGETGAGGYFSFRTGTLKLFKNFDKKAVMHEATHVWQSFKTHKMSTEEIETQATLVGVAYDYYNQESPEEKKETLQQLKNRAESFVEWIERITNAGDPKKIKKPIESLFYLQDYIALNVELAQIDQTDPDAVLEKMAPYLLQLKSADKFPPNYTAKREEFINKMATLVDDGRLDKLAVKVVQQNFSNESIDQLRRSVRLAYNANWIERAYKQDVGKEMVEILKESPDVKTFRTRYKNAQNLFAMHVKKKNAFSGYNVVKAYFIEMCLLAAHGKTQEAIDYFDSKIKPLVTGPIFLQDMDSETVRELWEKRK